MRFLSKVVNVNYAIITLSIFDLFKLEWHEPNKNKNTKFGIIKILSEIKFYN